MVSFGSMIAREAHVLRLKALLKRYPVVAILGARQVGKTTLAGEIVGTANAPSTRFDLEDPADIARLADPMLAHHHAQLWNASEIGRSFGVADTTVRGYLDKLTDALVVRQLRPWHENVGKRQVKAPKIYVRDSGLLHALLNLVTQRAIEGHPKLGRRGWRSSFPCFETEN